MASVTGSRSAAAATAAAAATRRRPYAAQQQQLVRAPPVVEEVVLTQVQVGGKVDDIYVAKLTGLFASVRFPARLLWRIPVRAASPYGAVPCGKAPPPRRGGSADGADDDKRPTPETAEETAIQTAAARPRPSSAGSPGSPGSAGGH